MPALRGAIIGFGSVAEHGHWPGYGPADGLEIVAVVDPSAQRRALAARLDKAIHVYATFDELAAAESLDFVDVASPPASHVALASSALERGWHVLCEKPLTLDPASYQRLAALAVASERALFTVHNWKAAPILAAAIEAAQSGAIGAVRHVDLHTWRSSHCKGAAQGDRGLAVGAAEDWRLWPETAGGGVLVDHGWHAFYLVLALVGSPPVRVRAQMHFPDGFESLEDAADVAVEFLHATAAIHLTWRASERRNLVVVHGEGGTITVDDDRLLLMPRVGKWDERTFDGPLSGGSHHADWFGGVLAGFRDEIVRPERRGANLREAGWCLALTTAAYRAARGECDAVEVRDPVAGRPAATSR